MEIKKKKEVQITLTLSLFEAEWLKEIMQNPLTPGQDPEFEGTQDYKMRKMFWDELSKCLD